MGLYEINLHINPNHVISGCQRVNDSKEFDSNSCNVNNELFSYSF